MSSLLSLLGEHASSAFLLRLRGSCQSVLSAGSFNTVASSSWPSRSTLGTVTMPHRLTDCSQPRPRSAQILCGSCALSSVTQTTLSSSARFSVYTSSHKICKTCFQNEYGVWKVSRTVFPHVVLPRASDEDSSSATRRKCTLRESQMLPWMMSWLSVLTGGRS